MAYRLGLVKPHVRKAADYFGPKHGIKVVYGFGPGSVPNSDHPKGLALDFMTSNKSVGDRLVADLMANAAAFNVTYIIWWRRIWYRGKGWDDYSGPRPHTDHVHVSFAASAGTGAFEPVANPLVPDSVEGLVTVFRTISDSLKWITDAKNWERMGLFAGGAVLVIIAIARLGGSSISDIGKVVKNAK